MSFPVRRDITNYFYGDTDETLALASERLRQKHPGVKIVGAYSPPFRQLTPDEDAQVVEMINQANPDVLWVALGLPKQERWIVAHRDRLKAPVIVAVGAAIKFHSGRVVPAPRWASQVWLGMVMAIVARAPHRLAKGLDLRPPVYGSLARSM